MNDATEYRVEVGWTPAHELVVSLEAAFRDPKTLELPAGWARAAREGLPRDVVAELKGPGDPFDLHWVPLLAWLCPATDGQPNVLAWLASLSRGMLYELIAPYTTGTHPPADLAAARDRWLDLLTHWDRLYFGELDPRILARLAADGHARHALQGRVPPRELVEEATHGLDLAPAPGISTVALIPQYHYRPWTLHDRFGPLRLILYPADIAAPDDGRLPIDLLRLTRALGDESRLHILRFLAGGPHSFTDVVRQSGLAKSTVNHHMVLLRAAGLVRVHDSAAGGAVAYSLRANAVETLGQRLGVWLTTPESERGA